MTAAGALVVGLLGLLVGLLVLVVLTMFVTWVACDTVAWYHEHEGKAKAKAEAKARRSKIDATSELSEP